MSFNTVTSVLTHTGIIYEAVRFSVAIYYLSFNLCLKCYSCVCVALKDLVLGSFPKKINEKLGSTKRLFIHKKRGKDGQGVSDTHTQREPLTGLPL